jgi:hypothetical protein
MCKENWNELNFNYKKLLDYQKGIGHHVHNYGKWLCKSVTSAIILTNWTKNTTKIIKTFKGEIIINAPIHMRELQTKGDTNCMLHEYWKLTYKMIKILQSYNDICSCKNL